MMGHMACRMFPEEFETFGAIRSPAVPAQLEGLVAEDRMLTRVDVLQEHSLIRAFTQSTPDVVLNCVGIIKQLDEAHDPVLSTLCNSLLPHRLAELCRATGAHLVHLSTDCVFSGERGLYRLEDNPDPVDLYGRTKLVGEVAGPSATTLRTSIVGRQLTGATGLFEWAISQRGLHVDGFRGAIYSGLTTRALCRVIIELLHRDALPDGLWQVASEPIAKFDLLVKLNEALDLGLDIGVNDTFRCDRSLDGSAFAAATGVHVPSWDEMLADLAADNDFYLRRRG
jgi:dTDP-4-dehydrorhamnose reductase